MNANYKCGYFKNLDSFLKNNSIPYKTNFFLKYEMYFKKGGFAKFYIIPSCQKQLAEIVIFLKKNNIPWKIIGYSSNLFFLDELNYEVIITTKSITGLAVENGTFEVECGYPLQEFVRCALIHGRGGVEGLEGVPGTIGGALFMNSGAYGYSISDHLISIIVISPVGTLLKLEKNECEFGFRTSLFKTVTDYVLLSATFELPLTDQQKTARAIETFHIARHSYQEFVYPNLGSMFSVKGDFYREFFKNNRFYSLVCLALKFAFKNPVFRFVARKRPNNKYFNKLALYYIKSSFSGYRPSRKSMNILINDGRASLDEVVTYISVIRNRLSRDTAIENEIVTTAADLSTPAAKKVVAKLREKGLLDENCFDNHSLG